MNHKPIRTEDGGRDNLSSYERCARLIEKYAPFYIKHGGGIISGTSKPRKKKVVKDAEHKKVKSQPKTDNDDNHNSHGVKHRRRKSNP
ncbi:hypothetical protein UFOVP1533_9 [uncultured Caudovirales phage]|uniref:Uncharacterized protein n=1 Tax=uncultured Caudovirales phage TaxID=2100421 RepID=A0A6J5QG29_9CAUD|nr:hypothetical protein UFOVP1086_9 [uncultured Caudovirales phage]CAB4212413.1 hypothetical protein UFOVP1440_9 [uncultured Caudovirales phage]CAB5228207.1 hypothetical protein UFOVP1533_9 [uncultured Caudovirales phage]